MLKPGSVFIDIDGVLFNHSGYGASSQWFDEPQEIEGARELLDELEKRGCHIVLVTARKECTRQVLVEQLTRLRFHYDQLIMGVTSGVRVIINDNKPSLDKTAIAITVKRNESLRSQLDEMWNCLGGW